MHKVSKGMRDFVEGSQTDAKTDEEGTLVLVTLSVVARRHLSRRRSLVWNTMPEVVVKDAHGDRDETLDVNTTCHTRHASLTPIPG